MSRVNFGAKPIMFPQPVLIIATYDENGVPNAMNAAWGITTDFREITISLSEHKTTDNLDLPGTYVLMKSASHMKETKELLVKSGREVGCVENCSMENEKVYRSAEEIPDDAGYFSLVIAKEKH